MTVTVIREGTAEGAARGPPSEGPPPTNIARAVKMYEENKGMRKNITWNSSFFAPPPITINPPLPRGGFVITREYSFPF